MQVAAFPLCWPEDRPRTTSRKLSRFDQTVHTAMENLQAELRRIGAKDPIISTSIPLRRDGLPLSKPPVDGDPGVAVYFTRKGQPTCIACDQYFYAEDNIQAIAKTLEAIRGIERWGGSNLMEQTFAGFSALPAASTVAIGWWSTLGVSPDATLAEAEAAYRRLAKANHPDNGGSHERMADLNSAIEEARKAKENN